VSNGTPREHAPTEAWVSAAVGQVLAEASRFATTLFAFATRPRTSAERWANGTSAYMNPLGFVAFAAAIYWAIANGAAALWPVPGDEAKDSILRQITLAIGPQVHYGLLGIAMHAVLRSLGSVKKVAGSVGVSFYAGGSVGLVLALGMVVVLSYFAHTRGTGSLQLAEGGVVVTSLFVVAMLTYAVLCLVLTRAMIGLHKVPGWKAAVGIVLAILLTALLFGSVLPEGPYGWHPYLSLSHDAGFSFSFGFRH
jgi:hypothetical protein